MSTCCELFFKKRGLWPYKICNIYLTLITFIVLFIESTEGMYVSFNLKVTCQTINVGNVLITYRAETTEQTMQEKKKHVSKPCNKKGNEGVLCVCEKSAKYNFPCVSGSLLCLFFNDL